MAPQRPLSGLPGAALPGGATIGLEIGGVVSASFEGSDVYAVYRVIDRGDAEQAVGPG